MNEYSAKPAASNGDAARDADILPIGTRLGDLELLALLGEGKCGIVYLAYDHAFGQHVALKEYMPPGLAMRTEQLAVTLQSPRNAARFSTGLKSFIDEARMLAQFNSPSLVKVLRFWEGNGTAYMVMPLYDGIPLRQALQERRVVSSEQWLKLLLADLFDAVGVIHHANCVHGEITPDNILLLKDGRPLLLDSGAARHVISGLGQHPAATTSSGFTPLELAAGSTDFRPGPWTDIYALAAVAYYLIAGKPPPPALARVEQDDMVPLRDAGKGRYGAAFLAALDKALAVQPEQRFRSIEEMRRALRLMEAVPRTLPLSSYGQESPGAPTTPIFESEPYSPHGDEQEPTQFDPHWHASPDPRSLAGDWAPRRNKSWMLLGLVLAAGIAAGVVWEEWTRHDEPAMVSAPVTNTLPAGQLSGGGDLPPPQNAPLPPVPSVALAPTATPPGADSAPVAPDASAGDNDVVEDAPAIQPETQSPELPAATPPLSDAKQLHNASASGAPDDNAAYLPEVPEDRDDAPSNNKPQGAQRGSDTAPGATMPPSKPRPQSKTAAATSRPVARTDAEGEFWTAATTRNNAPAYERYLSRYPQGRYAALARDRLASLRPAPEAEATGRPIIVTQLPQTLPPGPGAPRDAEQQASLKPSGMETRPLPPEETVSRHAPEPVTTAGKLLKLDGQTMIGDFSADPKTGIVSGTGRIVWSNGEQFEGTLRQGRKEGKGRFVWRSGQHYSGDWERDMPNGKGIITFANGNRYEGEVKNGLPHGQGVTRFRNGDVYAGTWVAGKSHGNGRYTWANGSYWEGEFRDDLRTGNGTLVFSQAALRAAREKSAAPSTGGASAGQAASGNDVMGK